MKQLASLLVFALLATSANAAVIPWTAILGPDNEVPPIIGSSGFGAASGTLDNESGLLTWSLEWAGLTGDAVAAHFHAPAGTSANAGVVVNIGSISGLSSPTMGSVTISALQVSDFLAELWYINVHTQANPSGEIRGQVISAPAAIPVPATLPLALCGMLLLIFRRMFKSQRSGAARLNRHKSLRQHR